MKKIKKPVLFATCAAAAIAGAGLLTSNNSVSATSHDYIYFETHTTGSVDSTICAIYDSLSNGGYEACDESYGSYDPSSNELVLKTGINDIPNGHVTINLDNATISSNGNIRSAIYTRQGDLTLDFGNYSFTDTPYYIGSGTTNHYSELGNKLTINSGTINIPDLIIQGPLEIKGGTINISPNAIIAIEAKESLKISGGTINIPSCNMAMSINGTDSSIEISGGTINANEISTSGISDSHNGTNIIKITGGEINLKSAENPAGFGINAINDTDIIINGGDLTIDGFQWGIAGSNSKIYFNDGTTTIKNSIKHTIWIAPAQDPENDIVFGENMGIKENTYVFYGDNEQGTGIADPNTVTITKGYTYRKHYGWEDIDSDKESSIVVPNTSGVKTPDTGIFSGENGNAIAIAASIATLTLLSSGIFITTYIIKRHKSSVKFNK